MVAEAIRIVLAHCRDDVVRMPTLKDFRIARVMLRCWYHGEKTWKVALGVRERVARYGMDPDTFRIMDGEAFHLARRDAEGEIYERHQRRVARGRKKVMGVEKPKLEHYAKYYAKQKEAGVKERSGDMLSKWRKGKEMEEFG